MQFALLTIDGSDVAASQVELLQPSERGLLKGQLVCRTCRGPAHFRRRSTNGNAACFAAKHVSGCPEAVLSDSPWPEPGDEEVARWEANENVIALAIDGAEDATEPDDSTARVRTPGQGGHRYARTGPAFGSTIQRGATNLLRQLVNWPTFKTSSVNMRLPSGELVPVHTFFSRVRDASREEHVGHLRGFWGLVHTLDDWNGRGLWINSPPAYNLDALRLFLPSSIHPAIIEKFGLASIDELRGRYVLLIDAARVSGGNRFMADVYQVEKFATILKPENDPND
ncbi:hypothetical protein SAMN04488690_4178 [Stenotrophomonas indicatrix]|uniref:Uncharacterized protein n=1 Tax=Stenotrophomonas indicatrix TaxID=2045451 RepID=A0A1W1H478_9GAMM|nr:hypothetical protein SAMN04488690_4178 [Stenotrophomonas indicatrix]